jgi:hypothetical protein
MRHPMAGVVNAPGRRVALITRCEKCGAAVQGKDFALRCQACGELLVQDSDLTERARPDGLVPFAMDEQAAQAAFAKWVSARHFAPQSLLKGDRQTRTFDGVFLPLWSFSANTTTDYAGRRGKRRSPMVGSQTQPYTSWKKVAGRVSRYFGAVTIPACSQLIEQLPPWPLNTLVPYAQGSSNGKRIIAYDVEPEYGFERARAFMTQQIDRDVRIDIGGSSQRVDNSNTYYNDPTYSLLLLPAWLLTYAHNGRTWSALINGTTGQVVGKHPRSATKITIFIATLIALAVVADVLLHL